MFFNQEHPRVYRFHVYALSVVNNKFIINKNPAFSLHGMRHDNEKRHQNRMLFKVLCSVYLPPRDQRTLFRIA